VNEAIGRRTLAEVQRLLEEAIERRGRDDEDFA
jgi:hypothetical protein